MKYILILLFLIPVTLIAQERQSMVLHGDTLFIRNWTTGDSVQLNKPFPSQVGQNGKVLSTNGTVYSWQSVAGGGDLLAAHHQPFF